MISSDDFPRRFDHLDFSFTPHSNRPLHNGPQTFTCLASTKLLELTLALKHHTPEREAAEPRNRSGSISAAPAVCETGDATSIRLEKVKLSVKHYRQCLPRLPQNLILIAHLGFVTFKHFMSRELNLVFSHLSHTCAATRQEQSSLDPDTSPNRAISVRNASQFHPGWRFVNITLMGYDCGKQKK